MSKQLEMYEVRFLPSNYAGMHGVERSYEIQARVNGQTVNVIKAVPQLPPYLTELEMLNRMALQIAQELRKQYEQDGSVS